MSNYTFTNNDGIKYKIYRKRPHYSYNADGLCDPPDYKGPKIHISPDLPPKREMAVATKAPQKKHKQSSQRGSGS